MQLAEGLLVLLCLGTAIVALFVFLPWCVRVWAENKTHKRLLKEREQDW